MKTDELIRMLAHDGANPPLSLAFRLWLALAIGGAAAVALFALKLGIRPDVETALQTWRYLAKLGIAVTCFASALWATARLARPQFGIRDVLLGLAVGPALLAAASAVELLLSVPSEWVVRSVGNNSSFCLRYVPLLAAAPLGALLVALRAGAPRSPAMSGAIAGLLAGSLGATLYALHCPDDSPLFVALWYTTGVILMVLLGAALGYRVLRW